MDLKKHYDIDLFVLYVEHGIRRAESKRDGDFVEKLCQRLAVDFTMVSVDAVSYAKTNRLSLEEAARMLRYDAFYETAQKKNCNKIATAHNANDNAETILFHLIRGSGPAGLLGIAPKRGMEDIEIIRPLLGVTREEIEADKADVRNILRRLGVLSGEAVSYPKTRLLEYSDDAPCTGCWYPEKQPGDFFREGEKLGEIRDYFGNVLFIEYAPQNGVLLHQCASLNILEKGPMVTYGVPTDNTF